MRAIPSWKVAPEAIPAWNPAFDYAPAELITGIVTEHGVIYKVKSGQQPARKTKRQKEARAARLGRARYAQPARTRVEKH